MSPVVEPPPDIAEPEQHFVTWRDVASAALLAQIVGGSDEASDHDDRSLFCIGRTHDCEHCAHIVHCSHSDPWDCVADAIDASPEAVALYLRITNLLDASQRAADLAELEPEEIAWLSDLGAFEGDEFFHADLEAAALLEDGHLPPGWSLR